MGIRDTVIAFGTVSGGGGSGADITSAVGLRLESYLATHPEATFYVRAEGEGWADSGVGAGDILVVDRSAPVRDGALVLAVIGGELVVRRFGSDTRRRPVLAPLTPSAATVPVAESGEASVWGVVSWVIRKV